MNLPQIADRFLDIALGKAKVGGTVHMHKIMERADLPGYSQKLKDAMKAKGFGMEVTGVTELKTYSPTMSVYVFDILRTS